MKIKCDVQVISKHTIDEMPNAWTNQDYFYILDQLGREDALNYSGIRTMVMIALSERSPTESARILLNYKLKDHLTKGQIQQLSLEMQDENAAEEYPDIFIQNELFNINQLLFKSYKGSFASRKAIELTMTLKVDPISYMKDDHWINEIIIKALAPAFGDHSAIVRLYKEEMKGMRTFSDASGIIWKTEISKSMDGYFDIRIYSSEFWLHKLLTGVSYETTIEVLELQDTL